MRADNDGFTPWIAIADMHRYLDITGNSGVVAYETGRDSITVQFTDGWCYLYDHRSAGARNIAKMQALAKAGQGLSTYISQNVKSGYARKWLASGT